MQTFSICHISWIIFIYASSSSSSSFSFSSSSSSSRSWPRSALIAVRVNRFQLVTFASTVFWQKQMPVACHPHHYQISSMFCNIESIILQLKGISCYWQRVPSHLGRKRLFAVTAMPPHENGRNSEAKSQKINPKVLKRQQRRGLQTPIWREKESGSHGKKQIFWLKSGILRQNLQLMQVALSGGKICN